MKHSGKIALGGLLAALSLVCMLLTIFPFADYALPALAGVLLIPIVLESGVKWGFMVYAVVGILNAILTPSLEAKVLFIAFFGYYPVLKALIERIRFRPLEWAAKLLLFNGTFVAAYWLMLHVFALPADSLELFGVNVPLAYRYAPQLMDVITEERVPAVFTSAGNPATWTARLHDAGCRVAHVVSSSKFALKSREAGVDAVVAEGFEAGGHNGREETTTMALVPQVRQAVDLPLIAAGGIATGAGMLAAFALGAEGCQLGTRFALSRESSACEAFKRRCVEVQEGGTILTLKKVIPTRLVRNGFCRTVEEAESRGADAEELSALIGRGRPKRGIFEGDLDEGELEIGQIAALIEDLPPAGEILRRLVAEYEAARGSLGPL